MTSNELQTLDAEERYVMIANALSAYKATEDKISKPFIEYLFRHNIPMEKEPWTTRFL
jgi:hypothetical protein